MLSHDFADIMIFRFRFNLHKLCSVFEGIQEPFVLPSACKSVVY